MSVIERDFTDPSIIRNNLHLTITVSYEKWNLIAKSTFQMIWEQSIEIPNRDTK